MFLEQKVNLLDKKNIHSYKNDKYIIEWLRNYYDKNGDKKAYLRMVGTDMQNNRGVFISNGLTNNDFFLSWVCCHIFSINWLYKMCLYEITG